MIPSSFQITAAWIFLVAASLLTFWVTAHLNMQMAAIAACMALASAKVLVVFRYFMSSDRITMPLQIFAYAWTIGCASMIFGVAWASV